MSDSGCCSCAAVKILAPQPPYLLLAGKERAFRSVHHLVSNLSFSTGMCVTLSSQAHLPHVSTLSGPGHQARYPASYTDDLRRRSRAKLVPLSCCLSAAGIRFLAILSCPGIQPPLRSAYRPPHNSAAGGPGQGFPVPHA